MRKYIFIIMLISQSFFAQWKLAGFENQFLFDISKIDSVLYVGESKGIYTSHGSGINDWEKSEADIIQVQRFYKHNNSIFAIANSGLYKSNIQGEDWEKINSTILPGRCLLMLDNVWLAGITSDGVYRSTDYGDSWSRNAVYDYDSLADVSSLLSYNDNIFAITQKGLQVSYDMGVIWHKVDKTISSGWPSNNTLLNINDTLFAGGESGLYKSIDLGQSWKYLGLKRVSNLLFINNIIFALTHSVNAASFSNNYGKTWHPIYSDGYKKGFSFQPNSLEIHDGKLFVATANGLYYMHLAEFNKPRLIINDKNELNFSQTPIYKKKDTLISIQNHGYQDLKISNIISNSPFITISPTTLIISPNSAQSIKVSIFSKTPTLVNSSLDIISNCSNSIQKIPIYIKISPIEYQLSQNFPNPFNPSTTIEYQISGENYVNLTIYNSVGEKISTIVNSSQEHGKHKIIFNAKNLSSGIYYYKIIVGEYMKTKKMLLVR